MEHYRCVIILEHVQSASERSGQLKDQTNVAVNMQFNTPPYDEHVVYMHGRPQIGYNSELGTFMIRLRKWKKRAGLRGLVKKSA